MRIRWDELEDEDDERHHTTAFEKIERVDRYPKHDEVDVTPTHKHLRKTRSERERVRRLKEGRIEERTADSAPHTKRIDGPTNV